MPRVFRSAVSELHESPGILPREAVIVLSMYGFKRVVPNEEVWQHPQLNYEVTYRKDGSWTLVNKDPSNKRGAYSGHGPMTLQSQFRKMPEISRR